MKNIHVLPTDKETRLFTSDSELILAGYPATTFKTGKNIYITSDEEIKEGDWFMSDFNSFPIHNIKELSEREGTLGWEQKDLKNNLKIILTDNKDLIKDGVQAIPDEFLEWFVKNPSCEEVEVVPYLESITDPITKEKYSTAQHRHFNLNKLICKYNYKIIIPRTTQQIIDEDFAGGLDMGQISAKQESKQDRACSNNCSTICGECQIFEFRPISGLEWLLGYIEELNKKGYKFIPSSKKEIVEHVTQMEKDNMINFLKSVFQQDNFNYEKAYNNFLKQQI